MNKHYGESLSLDGRNYRTRRLFEDVELSSNYLNLQKFIKKLRVCTERVIFGYYHI